MVIRKSGSNYKVKSKSGRTLGTHKTKKAAKKQLAAIEASKKRKGKS